MRNKLAQYSYLFTLAIIIILLANAYISFAMAGRAAYHIFIGATSWLYAMLLIPILFREMRRHPRAITINWEKTNEDGVVINYHEVVKCYHHDYVRFIMDWRRKNKHRIQGATKFYADVEQGDGIERRFKVRENESNESNENNESKEEENHEDD